MSSTTPTTRTALVSPQQIAREYGVPRTTVMDAVYRGHIPTVQVPGSRRTWIRRDVWDRLIGLDRPAA